MAKDRESGERPVTKQPRKKRPTRKSGRKHRVSRKPGRPHMCTPRVIDAVCQALSVSASQGDAAAYAGISASSLQAYNERGRKALADAGIDPEAPPPEAWRDPAIEEGERPFTEMLCRSHAARARGNISLLAIAHKCAKGGPVYEERMNPETGRLEQVQVGYLEPDPRTALKLLAVRQPRDYAEKRQLAVTGEAGAAIGVQVFLPVLEGEEHTLRDKDSDDNGG